MGSIRIRKRLESETLTLPELKPLVGKMVEIQVTEQPEVSPPSEPWEAAAEAVRALADYDFAAWSEQREFDRRHGQDHLR